MNWWKEWSFMKPLSDLLLHSSGNGTAQIEREERRERPGVGQFQQFQQFQSSPRIKYCPCGALQVNNVRIFRICLLRLYLYRQEEEEVGYASDFTLNIKCRLSSSSSGRSGDSVNQSLIQIPRYTYLLAGWPATCCLHTMYYTTYVEYESV